MQDIVGGKNAKFSDVVAMGTKTQNLEGYNSFQARGVSLTKA